MVSIDVSENLTLDDFQSSYNRIAHAKSLKKSPAPRTNYITPSTITLEIIFSVKASISIEKIAEELHNLNQKTPNSQWPDMVVILSHGVINYAVQFPGSQELADFLPPSEGSLSTPPGFYVLMVIKPTGRYTFNKMCGFMIAHLGTFFLGANLPNWKEILENTPDTGLISTGYQYNLEGKLLPVPHECYIGNHIPHVPLRVEDKKGNILGALQFLSWQDGAVISLHGKIKLEILLNYLRHKAINSYVTNVNGIQTSCVLPITQIDFNYAVEHMQAYTNLVIKKEPISWIKQKFADEGSSSPFMARLFIGILKLKDIAFLANDKKKEFDELYNRLMNRLLSIKTTAQEIFHLFNDHAKKVSEGNIAKISEGSIKISENINQKLRKNLESFLNEAVRIFKNDLQSLTKIFNYNIGFLYQKQNAFEKGISIMKNSDSYLSEYLYEVRHHWSENLIIDSRNALEHSGWQLPNVGYIIDKNNIIQVIEPQISGQLITNYVKLMTDRILCFAEEVTIHCMQKNFPTGFSIVEIPLHKRSSEMPTRFQVTTIGENISTWNIKHSKELFDEK